jgi:hypothetical protein
MHQLRQDLQATRALLEQPAAAKSSETAGQAAPGSDTAAAVAPSTPIEQRVQKLEESNSLLGSKIDEQYQTKVESASKYRARLHGIVLMNAFRNVGGTDNLDFPDFSSPLSPFAPKAKVGATLRQSEIGLEIFGPRVAGARTSADVQFDFAGGFPSTGNGVNFGIVRLQTAHLRFDWDQTLSAARISSPPLSPTRLHHSPPAFAFAESQGLMTKLREHRFCSQITRPSPCKRAFSTIATGRIPITLFIARPKPASCRDNPRTRSARHGRAQ